MTTIIKVTILAYACLCALAAQGRGDLVTTFNFDEWESLVGDYSTIDFTGFPDGTPISDQYAHMGVTFVGPTFIFGPTLLFENDGWGLHGPFGLHLFFDEPQWWIAVHHAANAMFELYYEGELQAISGMAPAGGIGSFIGVVASTVFDEVIITKPPHLGTHIGIDDLHWGGAEPKSPCPEVVGDLTGDCSVGVADLLVLLSQWGPCPPPAPAPGNCPADLTGSGSVGVDDLLLLLANWG